MNSGYPRPLVLPALRGMMGDWIYYSCLMDLPTLADRVDFADDIHTSTQLSDMIQRQLKETRAKEIAAYLASQNERLFNALVVATYRGKPNWHALSSVESHAGASNELAQLGDATLASVGFLTLQGDERLFALDGQHRLAGIKTAIEDGLSQDPFDKVPVIFVAHGDDEAGLERTRRLFTTLNKTAKPVSKGDTIALDEDDVMALSVRWLVDREGDLFCGDRIAFVPTNNLPPSNVVSLTTIGNLYDILTIFFSRANTPLRKKRPDLKDARPESSELDAYFAFAKDIFVSMRRHFPELDEFFSATNTEPVVCRHRTEEGGNVLYKPLGLDTFSTVIAYLSDNMPLDDAFERAAELPRQLQEQPYTGLMWNPVRRTISNRHRVTTRELLLHMLGSATMPADDLLDRYRKETGNKDALLPDPVV
ncbi:MAG: DGQHR domain-containing protein [Gammaproteobacteria bacterium]|nr:DGQHR domain-containing protein [Gammaproteobacteria bacterium]